MREVQDPETGLCQRCPHHLVCLFCALRLQSVIQEAYDFTSVSKAPPSPAPAPQQVASTETKIPAAVSPAPTKSQLPSIGGSASKGSTGRATDRYDRAQGPSTSQPAPAKTAAVAAATH